MKTALDHVFPRVPVLALSRQVLLIAGSGLMGFVLVAGGQDNITWSGSGSEWDTTGTADWLNGTTPWAYTNGDTVTFDDSATQNNTVELEASLLPNLVIVSNTAVPYTFADGTITGGGNISGSASLVKEGAGTLTVMTANTYTGTTTISAGTLQIGNGSPGDIGAGNVTNNASLVFAQVDSATHYVQGSISGTGSLNVYAFATIVLAANNTYTGPTTISAGTLQVGNGGVTGSLGTYSTVTNNGALVFDGSGSISLPYDITGAGSLAFDGTGQVSLAGATLNYQGNTYISNAVVQLDANNQLPNANNVAGSSGDLNVDGGSTTPGTLDMNGYHVTVNALSGEQNVVNGIITNSSMSNTTNVLLTLQTVPTIYNGQIMDHGTTGAKTELFVTGPGTLTLNPTNSNLFSGGIVVSNGSLALGAPNDVNTAENQLAPGSGPITLLGTNTIFTVAGAPPAVSFRTYLNLLNPIIIPAGQNVTVYNSQRGNIGSTLTGSGTLNLVSTYLRGGVDGNWSSFGGQIVLSTANTTSEGYVGFGNTNGLADAELSMITNVVMYCGTVDTDFPFYALFPIGALSGGDSSDEIASLSTGNAGGHPATFEIGGLNQNTTYSGGIIDSNNLLKVGTGTLTLNSGGILPTNNIVDGFFQPTGFEPYNIGFIGTTTVSNGTLALDAPVVLTNCTGVILAGSNAVLDARDMGYISNLTYTLPDGATQELVITSTFEAVTNQTLSGYGTLDGNLQADPGSIFNVGLPTGTFEVTSNASLSGAVIMNLDDTNAPANSELVVRSYTIGEGATLTVTNVGPGLYNGATFQLFNQGVPGFASVTLPASDPTGMTNYVWSNNIAANGSITLISGGPVTPPFPPPITFHVSGTSLTLTWPPAYSGYVLQAQTNTVGAGLGTNWVDVTGSTSVTDMTITINHANGCVFYRLAQQ